MPSKKRKYNARFPAGRIKKIMQTDEEVGKVAQAVPIIISRTLELFVESLLGKALQVTSARNAKTLSPSHVKQCILAEARFDFLRDLVKNIPDVSAAEEKELSEESSPNSSRFPDAAPPRRIAREDSNSSSSCEVIRVPQPPTTNILPHTREQLKRVLSEPNKTAIKLESPGPSVKIDQAALLNIPPIVTPQILPCDPLSIEPSTSTDTAIDLSTNSRPVRTANFYQETLITETVPHNSVIKINPIYTTPQPSTSYTNVNPIEVARKVEIAPKPPFVRHNSLPRASITPVTHVINIDFSKNITKPEIKVIDAAAAVANVTKIEAKSKLSRQTSKSKIEVKKEKPPSMSQPIVDIDSLNSGNLQIDEDYDT